MIEDEKFYFKKDLLDHLKKLGLPCTRQTLIAYEKKGLVPTPRRTVAGFKKPWRMYTGAEIKDIVRIISEKTK